MKRTLTVILLALACACGGSTQRGTAELTEPEDDGERVELEPEGEMCLEPPPEEVDPEPCEEED